MKPSSKRDLQGLRLVVNWPAVNVEKEEDVKDEFMRHCAGCLKPVTECTCVGQTSDSILFLNDHHKTDEDIQQFPEISYVAEQLWGLLQGLTKARAFSTIVLS